MAKQAAGSRKQAPPAPAEPRAKAITSMAIEPETLAELKKLAADRRCRVNDLVVEAIDALLARSGR